MNAKQTSILDLSRAIEEFHVSQLSFGDSWADKSFGEEGSFSLDDSTRCSNREKIRHMCECIDGALAVITSPSIESRKGSLPNAAFCFDTPPSRPRRSFDVGSKYSLLRAQSAKGHDRFQLSKSEHQSRSFRAPKQPSRQAEPFDCEDQGEQQAESSKRPSLDGSQESSRDVIMVPPSRTSSGLNEVATPKQRRRQMSPPRSPLSQAVTLRASAGRVLHGTKELSTSEHLRRSCPSARPIS